MAQAVAAPRLRPTPNSHSESPVTTVARLNSAGASAGGVNRSSAFSMPMASAASDTSSKNGIMIRVSCTVSSVLPGICSKPAAHS